MATVLTTTYTSNTAITFDISSLAASATYVAGRASTQVDNTSTQYVDCIVSAGVITSGTTPAVGTQIALYVYGSNISVATANIDTITGTDGAFTLSGVSILNSLRFAGAVSSTATGVTKNYFLPFSIAQLFGGVVPKYWGLYMAHNQTNALAASQVSQFTFAGITYTAT